jgi:hypothetical protein
MDTGEKTYDLNQLPDYQKKVVEPLSEDVQQGVIKEFLTSNARKEHYKTKTGSLEEQNTTLSKENVEFKKASSDKTPAGSEGDSEMDKRLSRLEYSDKKAELVHEYKISPVAASELLKRSQDTGKSVSEVFKNDSWFKAGLSAEQSQSRAEDAVPTSSGKSLKFKNKSWSEMNKKERKENFSKVFNK